MTKLISALLCVILACLPCAAMADTDLTSPLANKVATTIAIPYPAIPLTTISSSQYNANLGTIASLLNGNLDSANVNLARGIGANYITASGAGVTGLFQPGSYTFTGSSTNQVPLTVAQGGGSYANFPPTSNIFQVCGYFNPVSTTQYSCPDYVDSGGAFHALSVTFLDGSFNQLYSTAGNAGSALVPPLYINGAPASSGNTQTQVGSCTFAGASSCVVTFENPFTSSLTYSCWVDLGQGGAGATNLPYVANKTSTGMVIYTDPTTVLSTTDGWGCVGY